MAYFIIIHIWLAGSWSTVLSQKTHEESEAPWACDIQAFAFLNDLGFNYSLCSHVALSGSFCLHPVNELSGSDSPVEAMLLVHWVADLGHLSPKPVALISIQEDAALSTLFIALGRSEPLLFTDDFLSFYFPFAFICAFSFFFPSFLPFFFKKDFLCFNPCLSKRFFFLFGNRFASVCTEAVSGVMDRAGSHPRSISVPN